MTSHGVNKTIDKCLWHIVPFLTSRGLEFVDVRRLSSSVVDRSSKPVQKMLYESENGVEGWPVQYMNSIGFKKVLSKKSTVGPRVFLLEKIPRMLSENWNHMRPKNLIDVTSHCKSTSRTVIFKVQNNKLHSLTLCDASPYHNVCSTPSVPLHDPRVGIPFTVTSIHTETVIGVINAEA